MKPHEYHPHIGTTCMHEVRQPDGTLVAVHARPTVCLDDHLRPIKGAMIWYAPDGTPGLGGAPVSALPLYGSHLVADWPADGWQALHKLAMDFCEACRT